MTVDVFMRGKYRDFILPMFVLRRLDCLLEPSKFMMEMVGKMNPGQLCRQLIMKPVKMEHHAHVEPTHAKRRWSGSKSWSSTSNLA